MAGYIILILSSSNDHGKPKINIKNLKLNVMAGQIFFPNSSPKIVPAI